MRTVLCLAMLAVAAMGCHRADPPTRSDAGQQATPVPVVASAVPLEAATPGFVQIAAGKDMTCARTDKGEVFCWGDNAYTTTTMSASSVSAPIRTSPRKMFGVSNAVDIAVGASQGCAVDASGAVRCWLDRTVDAEEAGKDSGYVYYSAPMKDAIAIRMSRAPAATACVLHRGGGVSCATAQRGSLFREWKKVDGLPPVETVAPGDLHTCALSKAGALTCWGSNFMGGLGRPGTARRESPKDAPPVLEHVSMLTSGSAFSCAVKDAKAVCWGSNGAGQAGGTGDKHEAPTEVPGLGRVRNVQAAVYHACAVDDAGHVRCWGDDRFGQLGTKGADVPGIEGAVDVAVGEWHSCALLKPGQIYCWGRNHRGQLGDGSSKDSRTPRPVVVKPT